MDLAQLNDDFAIKDTLRFEKGPGGLPVAVIANAHADSTICLLGAHVMSFRPNGQEDLLWMSAKSMFKDGEPIRGGIPICWPWFGQNPANPELPAHGFARRKMWQVLSTSTIETDGGATVIRLGLEDDEATHKLWEHRFSLELTITVGHKLKLSLHMHNPSSQTYTCTSALHTYFNAGLISLVSVHGLDGCAYIDTVQGRNTRHEQEGTITFDQEVDRVYVDTAATCRIDIPSFHRSVKVAKEGSHTTVVWNPWIAKSQRMPDFGDDEYLEMLCVETANAAADAVTILPCSSHTTTVTISASQL